jgi:DNA-binding transcriptional MerR regulator
MDKSPEAFRTISEVAEALETPAHVLRFWESRFPQIRPVKRAGGRRYYRPADVALLTGIKRLLHDEGLTIRGVQKILREQGIRHVSGLTDEVSPEEAALDAAMLARLDVELSGASPEETAEATAAALEAALDPVEATVLPFPGEPVARPAPIPDEPPAPLEPAELRISSISGGTLASAAEVTLPARLRALPRTALATRRAELLALRARIAAVRDRMAGPPPAP